MTEIIVTDHALVRWLERARGIEMEDIRAELAENARPFAKIGAMHAEVGGLWLVFDGVKLVTVTPEKPDPRQTARHDRYAVNGTDNRGEEPHWKGRNRRGGKSGPG